MNISHWISAILSALVLGACVHFAVHVARVNDRSWPKAACVLLRARLGKADADVGQLFRLPTLSGRPIAQLRYSSWRAASPPNCWTAMSNEVALSELQNHAREYFWRQAATGAVVG